MPVLISQAQTVDPADNYLYLYYVVHPLVAIAIIMEAKKEVRRSSAISNKG